MLKLMIERKNKIKQFLTNDDTRNKCRLENDKTSFTRNRKIHFSDLLFLTLNKQGRTTSFELRDYELNKKGGKKVNYSEEAYLKQRRKLNPKVFKEANQVYLKPFYENEENEIKRTKGYIECAIDGSIEEIPNTPENRRYFGFQKTQNERQPSRASLSSIYDINNCFYLDVIVDKYKTSEIEMAKKNIEEAHKVVSNNKLLILFDRGYPSLEFFIWLNKRGIKYLMRTKDKDYKKEKASMKSEDEILNIEHTYPRGQIIRDKYPELYEEYVNLERTEVRITKIKLKTGEDEYLISNLEKFEFDYNDLKEMYNRRWKIEESYNTIKNKLKIEFYTGNLPQFVYQDIYAQTVIYNQIQDIMKLSNEELKKINENKQLKHDYKVNENKAIGLFKEKFIKIMINGDQEEEYEKLFKDMAAFSSIVRKNRKTQPRLWNHSNKYRTNMKPSF